MEVYKNLACIDAALGIAPHRGSATGEMKFKLIWPLRAVLIAAALGVWLTSGTRAAAQTAPSSTPIDANTTEFSNSGPYTSLPYSGTTPIVGSAPLLGSIVSSVSAANALAPSAIPPPELTIVPSLGVQELFTTNATGASTGRQGDFVTSITPGLLLTEQRPRLRATIDYHPSANIYAKTSSQDYIAQQLNAFIGATLLPRALFLSLRGFATQQSTIGGLPPGGTSVLARNNRTSTESFQVSPSAQHRFGDIGTAYLRFDLYHTVQSGTTLFAAGSTTPFFTGTSLTTKQESASFTTGSVLGRFNDTVAFDAAQDTSNIAITNGARQTTYSDTLRFAVTRHLFLIGEVGHEDIRYNGVPPTRINDILWNGGFSFTPVENSLITVRYGHQEGFNSVYAQGSYPVTARTQVFIGTSESLGTQAQLLQSNLAGSSLNAAGAPINSETGAPILLTNQLLGTQSSLLRIRQISAGTTTTWSRDVLGLSFLDDQEKLVSTSPGVAGFSQNSLSGSISLSRALTPRATALTYLQYGRSTTALNGGTSPVYSGQLSLVYRLDPTLSANAQYTITRQIVFDGGTDLINSVGIGFIKIF